MRGKDGTREQRGYVEGTCQRKRNGNIVEPLF